MLDLSDHIVRRQFVDQLHKDVDAFCREEFKEDPRNHLGASIIGHDCAAYGWNTFRWLKQEAFVGKQLRLFNRGHEEEARFVRWMEGAGFKIWSQDEKGDQFRIEGSDGHFGGSLDGVGSRSDVGVIPLEYKTHNEANFTKLAGPKNFKALYRSGGKGLLKAQPKHYKQMCSYGKKWDFTYGLYCAVNKNTDELHFELVPLDWTLADDLYRKADIIIRSQTQPQKIALVDTYADCKHCDFSGICHKSEAPEKNCRSCRNAFPVANAEWFCQRWNSVIPKATIPTGCDSYTRII